MGSLKDFLDAKVLQYNNPKFIESDPIQVPHLFSKKEDIEIAGFLTATIAWGNRKSIIKNAKRMVELLDHCPHDFVMHHNDRDLEQLRAFVHRTFNGIDCIYFLKALGNIYRHHGGIGQLLESQYAQHGELFRSMVHFREVFFRAAFPGRTAKHLANIENGAIGKRLNMFLRWMVRRDKKGVDFGIWEGIPMHALFMPLDVHSGTVARKLGLLERKQNDWRAVTELTECLLEFDPVDPVRYDFALFGMGSFEKF